MFAVSCSKRLAVFVVFATLGLEIARPAAGQLLGSLADEAARMAERALREFRDSAAAPMSEASGGGPTNAPAPASEIPQPMPEQTLNNMSVPLDKPLDEASMPVSRETGSRAPTQAAAPAAEAVQTPVRITASVSAMPVSPHASMYVAYDLSQMF